MKDEDIPIGSHFWAKCNGELLVIVSLNQGYYACGSWELGFSLDELEFLEFIERPKEESTTKLYYN